MELADFCLDPPPLGHVADIAGDLDDRRVRPDDRVGPDVEPATAYARFQVHRGAAATASATCRILSSATLGGIRARMF